jgi:outer membrane protein assembly factor BamB
MHRHTVALSSLSLCLAACGALTACAASGAAGSAPGAARLKPAAHRVPATPAPTASPSACGPARRAWAAEVTDTGKVAWQVRLPTDPAQSGIALRPLVTGGEAVFAEFNGVYALRSRDGHRRWRRTFPVPKADPYAGMVYGLWRWRGTVVVLVGQVSASARLVSLNAATGAVRWTLPLSRQGVSGNLTLTADGGLAMIRGYGTLSVADLTTGRLRWSRTAGHSPGPAAVGTVVAAAANGRAVGYDDRTGAVLWTRRGLPGEPTVTAAGGLVLVRSDVIGGGAPTAVTALAPRTGRVVWRFDPGVPADIPGAGPAGIVMATYNPDRLYLVSPATGRPRWSAHTAAAYMFPDFELIVTAGNVVAFEGRGAARLVDRRAADGKVLWSAPLGGFQAVHVALTSGPAGQDVVAAMDPPGTSTASRLRVFRLASGKPAGTAVLPTLVQAPLAVAGSDTLVQLDDPVCAVAVARTAAGHSSLRSTASPSISIAISRCSR